MRSQGNRCNLITVRLTEDESNELDHLMINLDRTKSDVIVRACKLYLNMDRPCTDEAEDGKKTKKPVRVHVRMSDADMDGVKKCGIESGETISQVIRRAVRAFYEISNTPY